MLLLHGADKYPQRIMQYVEAVSSKRVMAQKYLSMPADPHRINLPLLQYFHTVFSF